MSQQPYDLVRRQYLLKRVAEDSYYVEACPNELPSWILNNTVHTVVLLYSRFK